VLDKERAAEILQIGFDEAVKDSVEVSVRIKAGRGERSHYIAVTELVEAYRKKAEEYGVELVDRTEEIMQEVYRQIAMAHWTAEILWSSEDPEITEMLSVDERYSPSVTSMFLKAVESLLKDHSIKPTYTYKDFLEEANIGLSADLLEAEILADAGFLTEDNVECKVTKILYDYVRKQIEQAES
jgi:hypothetical protein